MNLLDQILQIRNEFQAEYMGDPMLIIHPEFYRRLEYDIHKVGSYYDKPELNVLNVCGLEIHNIHKCNDLGLNFKVFDKYDEPIIYAVAPEDTKIIRTNFNAKEVIVPLRSNIVGQVGGKLSNVDSDNFSMVSVTIEKPYTPCMANSDHGRDMVFKMGDLGLQRVGGNIGKREHGKINRFQDAPKSFRELLTEL